MEQKLKAPSKNKSLTGELSAGTAVTLAPSTPISQPAAWEQTDGQYSSLDPNWEKLYLIVPCKRDILRSRTHQNLSAPLVF